MLFDKVFNKYACDDSVSNIIYDRAYISESYN